MSDKANKISNLIGKINEAAGSTVLKVASQATHFGVLDTPFSTVNTVVGGLPLGRFTTIAGPQHTGKGAFCLQTVAHLMSKDPEFFCLWTDAENAFDFEWASKLGIDLDRLILQRYTKECDTMEKLLDKALEIIKTTEAINMWVIDSIGALVPKGDVYDSKDKDKSLESANMLQLQRKLGEFFRKANIIIAPNDTTGYLGCAVLCIGQVYTAPTTTGIALEEVRGGNAFKHWAHLRLMFRRGPKAEWPEKIKYTTSDGSTKDIYPGWAGRIKIDKTRLNGNEGQEVILKFMLGRGFDSKEAAISAAFGLDIIERSGPTYRCSILPDGKMKGKQNVIDHFMNNEEAFNQLVELINSRALQEHTQNEQNQQEEVKSNE